MIFTSEACRALLSEGLVIGLAHGLAVSWNVAALESHLIAKLGSSEVFGLVLHNHLVEQVIFLVEIFLAKRLHSVALLV